ncbi:MAG: efflux RND transporter periplasmic adaptor subunit, partial [Rubricella sp.]
RSGSIAERLAIRLEEADRSLRDTELRAPFDALVENVAVVEGRRVSVGEQIATLVDPDALEIGFRVTASAFERLSGPDGVLAPRPITIIRPDGENRIALDGSIERAGPLAAEGGTGRTVFAVVAAEAATRLRPGDFVEIAIEEPPISDVARLPASALTRDGRILVVGEGMRLEEIAVTVLRRIGDVVLVADAPEGARYVVQRAPQLGPGVLVREAGAPLPEGESARSDGPRGG